MNAQAATNGIQPASNAGGNERRPAQRLACSQTDKPLSYYQKDLQRKLTAIKQELGSRLICHPDYQPNPLHSLNPEVYIPARAEHVREIARQAERSRRNNPAWRHAQAVIRAIGLTH